jgi:hypothetical protein
VNEQQTEMLHYRPEKDDVVVYSPELDEIRIHAGTKGEREVYRKQFGQRLFGDDNYFSQKKAYTLEPLRTSKADALDVEGVGGDLERVVLREYEVAFDNGFEEVLIKKATDIFAAAEERLVRRDAIPTGGRLVRAAFDLYFAGKKKARKLQIRTPNTLKLGRHCDARVVQKWLSKARVSRCRGRRSRGQRQVWVDVKGWRARHPIVWTDVRTPYGTAAAADKPLAVFGALSFWWMGEHGTPRIDTSEHVWFANDQLAVRFIEEIDFDYCAVDSMAALITAAV